MSDYTVLVLGAGASLSYGMPLGKGLVEKICELLPSNDVQRMGDVSIELHNFLASDKEFFSSWRSISNRDTTYALIEFRQRLIGKLSIAYVIARAESTSQMDALHTDSSQDNWYRYLWQDCLISNCKSLDDLKQKRIRVISFNYDRSLEYFLSKRIAATYLTEYGNLLNSANTETWAKQAFEDIGSIFQITHPYGTLGSVAKIPYGGKNNTRDYGIEMASNIKVIGEDRTNSDGFEKAKKWLSEAKKVVFLGFSYDETNMERLGLSSGLPRRIQTNQSINSRQVFPLTYGLERAERLVLTRKYFSDFDFEVDRPSNDYSPISETHQTMKITQYLRRYGGLTEL